MRGLFGIVLVAGLALAGFAVYLVQNFIGQNEAQMAQQRELLARVTPLVEVYIVNKPIPYGTPLTRDDVEKALLPERSLPDGAFTDEADLFPGSYDRPRLVSRQLEAREVVIAAKVTEPGGQLGLTGRIAPGMRAFAINVDVASGVSGFLQPGNIVDVYWTGNAGELTEGASTTKLIEAAVKIVAIDQISNAEITSGAIIARTVTVEVTPEQVARLAQAQATGTLALSLVGFAEEQPTAAVEVDSRRLLGVEERPVEVVVPERVCTVKTRRGADTIETPIECPP